MKNTLKALELIIVVITGIIIGYFCNVLVYNIFIITATISSSSKSFDDNFTKKTKSVKIFIYSLLIIAGMLIADISLYSEHFEGVLKNLFLDKNIN